MKALLLVFLGGGAGSALRYLAGKFLNNPEGGIPYGTFIVNIIGSLIIGLVLGYALKNENLSNNLVLLIATGFCGGFTTFSSFAHENHIFLKSGDLFSFAAYTIGSITIGLAAVFIGIWLTKSF